MPPKSAVGEIKKKEKNFAFLFFGGSQWLWTAVSINTESKNHGLTLLRLKYFQSLKINECQLLLVGAVYLVGFNLP